MEIQSDKKYIRAVFVVLNRIKDKLRFNSKNELTVDYMLDLNVKWRTGNVGLTEEKDILQLLKNDGVITDFDKVDYVAVGESQTSQYQVYEIYHFKVSNKFDGYYDNYQRLQSVVDNFLWFDGHNFYISLRSKSVKGIPFDTERETPQVYALFQVMVEHWKNRLDEPISGSDIVKQMAKYGSKVNISDLKNIFSNVRNKKIKPAGLEDNIQLGYNTKLNGWYIDIKR